MKYLKEFATQQEYEAYIANTNDLPNVSLINEDESVKYTPTPPDYSKEYLTFVALEDGTFSISGNNSVDYSLDGGETWTTLASGGNTPTIHTGEKIMWKKRNALFKQYSGFGRFSSTGKYNVEGNAMSLKYGDDFIGKTDFGKFSYNNIQWFFGLFYGDTSLTSAENLVLPATTFSGDNYSYASMFYGCTSLVKAPKVLPATTLSDYCYAEMFKNCTSLTISPELPATTLKTRCYDQMFNGCTSLTTAPELHATTLAQYCYNQMFYGCTSLNYIKMLAVDISAGSCLANWVRSVSATGTFVKATSQTSLPTGDNGIPENWTVQNA